MRLSAELAEFDAACRRQGVDAALTQLNRRVPHRYTAIYELAAGLLKNRHLIDKEGEASPEFLLEVPLADSFCQFVLRDGSFLTNDSASDERLNGHPYQGVMVSYHGVPILDDSGELFGSLCHFDVQSQPLSDDEFELLQRVARVVPGYVKRSAR